MKGKIHPNYTPRPFRPGDLVGWGILDGDGVNQCPDPGFVGVVIDVQLFGVYVQWTKWFSTPGSGHRRWDRPASKDDAGPFLLDSATEGGE